MAIVINSLTPINPVVPSGSTIEFQVDAIETNSLNLTYEWQISTDGVNYSGQNLPNNTSSIYTTSVLTAAQNNLYIRVVISNGVISETVNSNEYVGIEERIITVTSAPLILTQVNSNVDNYPNSTTLLVGQTLSYTVTSALQNTLLSSTDTSLVFQWQELVGGTDPSDPLASWNPISPGGDVSITTTIEPFGSTPETYYKKSIFTIQNINFTYNLKYYRVSVSYPGASNSPTILPPTVLYVSPEISIYRQPGVDDDTVTSFCYKTGIPSSDGNIKLEVGALSSGGTSLSYNWEYTLLDNPTEEQWAGVQSLVDDYNAIYKPGTNGTSFKLELQRMIYYEILKFRCRITGSIGEVEVLTDTHRVYMKDVQVTPIVSSNVNVIEDKYGPIENREFFPESIQRAEISASLNNGRNTGLNGNITLIFERQLPGTSEWVEVGTAITENLSDNQIVYTQFPGEDANSLIIDYQTQALRYDTDDGTKFRLKISSSALFDLLDDTKTLIPYTSSEILVNVYRTAFITSNPQDSRPFVNSNASFAIDATPSSGNTISYQWQYNTSSSTSGWLPVPDSAPFSGVNTNLLVYSNVPANPTYRFFRCVVTVPNQLSSVTSTIALVNPRRDLFTNISNINDIYALQFQNVSFQTSATSLSAGTISYQWQRSVNYNPVLPNAENVATWTDLTGETTNTLNILSVALGDDAYYRCKVTSPGGEIDYTNVAKLSVQIVSINVLTNIPNSITFLEGESGVYTFECLASSTVNTPVNYQWQIKRPTDSDFVNLSSGFGNSSSNTRFYTPDSFERSLDGSLIRCLLTAENVPFSVTTNFCQITVNRRFYYFADTSTKTVLVGQQLFLDLNPTWTGGVPFYQWETKQVGQPDSSWTEIPSETGSELIVSVVNQQMFRCRITLDLCNQHQYFRNNAVVVSNVNTTDYTVPVTVSVIASPSKPTYYSQQIEKTGAAIGTVICVPKPPGYVNNNSSATTDDISQWKIATSGDVDSFSSSFNPSSVVTSGAIFNINKPSWSDSSYKSPKWVLTDDRFKGYIELRGQWLNKSEFRELYRVIGDSYGSTPGENGRFRLPNPYGKKLLGTGNVNNNAGSVSIVPLFGPNGLSGGDKNVPGSIGGRYVYGQSAQLPPGSPGITGVDDGLAGVSNPATFSLGTFRTSGFDEISSFVQPTFGGTVRYSIGGTTGASPRTPTHQHYGYSVGYEDRPAVLDRCNSAGASYSTQINPRFPETGVDEGTLDEGPAGVPASERGRSHKHGMTLNGTAEAGNGKVANEGDGIGSGGGSDGVNGSFTMAQAGMSISSTELTMTNQSRPIFDGALRFYFRNNENIPIQVPYFRLRYMIKAY